MARVNLPHIGNRKCIILFYNDFFNNIQGFTFPSRNLYLNAPFGYQVHQAVPGPQSSY
jgi:hypothetical protein